VIRRATVLALASASLFATVAAAAPPAGTYHGHWGKSKSANVAFSVSHGVMHNFHTTVAAMCYDPSPYGTGTSFVTQTFFVPRAKIHSGKVNTTYKIRDSHGNVLGKRTVTATFKGGHATGTLSGSSSGCTIAKYHWKASH
jgi:hypothetical protein